MPIHSATFQNPGRELNPLMVPVRASVTIEVFQDKPTGPWQARERSSKTVMKLVGRERSVYAARFRVARLFTQQVSPWSVDGTLDPAADFDHFHFEVGSPSLCGSRYHQREFATKYVIVLPELRAGRAAILGGRQLCPVCVAMIDRSPQPGDRIRHRVSNTCGMIIGTADNDPTTRAAMYFVQFDSGESRKVPGGELALTLYDSLPPL